MLHNIIVCSQELICPSFDSMCLFYCEAELVVEYSSVNFNHWEELIKNFR
jgi:hypothetical protein